MANMEYLRMTLLRLFPMTVGVTAMDFGNYLLVDSIQPPMDDVPIG